MHLTRNRMNGYHPIRYVNAILPREDQRSARRHLFKTLETGRFDSYPSTCHRSTLRRNFLLIPYGLLAELPEATCREDIDSVVAYNEQVRDRLNKMLGSNWKNLVKKLAKNDLKKLFITHPQTLKDLLALYKNKRPQPYDFTIDPLGEIIWESLGHEAAEFARTRRG
jgi:hypothetical protein